MKMKRGQNFRHNLFSSVPTEKAAIKGEPWEGGGECETDQLEWPSQPDESSQVQALLLLDPPHLRPKQVRDPPSHFQLLLRADRARRDGRRSQLVVNSDSGRRSHNCCCSPCYYSFLFFCSQGQFFNSGVFVPETKSQEEGPLLRSLGVFEAGPHLDDEVQQLILVGIQRPFLQTFLLHPLGAKLHGRALLSRRRRRRRRRRRWRRRVGEIICADPHFCNKLDKGEESQRVRLSDSELWGL